MPITKCKCSCGCDKEILDNNYCAECEDMNDRGSNCQH